MRRPLSKDVDLTHLVPHTQPTKLLTKGPKNVFVIHQHFPAQVLVGGAKGQILVKSWSKKMLSAWSNISGSIDEAGRAAWPAHLGLIYGRALTR